MKCNDINIVNIRKVYFAKTVQLELGKRHAHLADLVYVSRRTLTENE